MLELIILIFLIFLNGLFVMAEISLVSARKSRLENTGQTTATKKPAPHSNLSEHPELFLSTAQIGITLIAILTGFYSGEKFSADLQPYLEKIPYLRHYAADISTALILDLRHPRVHHLRRTDPKTDRPAAGRTDRPSRRPARQDPVADHPSARLAAQQHQQPFLQIISDQSIPGQRRHRRRNQGHHQRRHRTRHHRRSRTGDHRTRLSSR